MVYAYTAAPAGPELEAALAAMSSRRPDKICFEDPNDPGRPALSAIFESLKSGDSIVVASIKDFGMSVMELLDFSLQTDMIAVEIASVLDSVTSRELRLVRGMDLEAKTEQELLARSGLLSLD
jgi:DNA invertase Pin-like site-specific DNA recombinase